MTDLRPAEVDAIRYAIVKRLATGFRHALMGDLQALQMSAQLAARLVQADTVNGERVVEKVGALPRQCAAVLLTSNAIFAWLHPDSSAITAVSEGVKHCAKWVGEDRVLREMKILAELTAADVRVSEAALRELVVVAIFALADANAGAIDVEIVDDARGGEVELTLRARAATRDAQVFSAEGHRAFTWRDVEVLADAHAVAYAREENVVSFRFANRKSTLAEAPLENPAIDSGEELVSR